MEKMETAEKVEKTEKMEKKSKKDEKTNRGVLSWYDYLKLILINVVVTVAILYVYHIKFVPKIVFADFSFYLNGLKNLYIAGKINEGQLRAAIEDAVRLFNEEVKKGKYVFLSDVVLNPPDKIPKVPLRKDYVDAGKTGSGLGVPGFQGDQAPIRPDINRR